MAMTIYSGSYNANSALDVRDMYQLSSGAGAASGMGMGWAGMAGMGFQALSSGLAAYGQAKLGKLQHNFNMQTANWQNQMIGLQRQAIGIQAQGQILQGKSAKLQADTQAAIARINARLAESAAQGTLFSGQRQEQAKRLETAAFKSRQRVGFAASGVDLSGDSAVRVLTSTDIIGEVDANTIAANAIRAAWGYRTEAANHMGQALMANANGQMMAAGAQAQAAATRAGMPSTVTPPVAGRPVSSGQAVASSLLGSATQIATTYYSLSKQGFLN
jgi:hypothetical protein